MFIIWGTLHFYGMKFHCFSSDCLWRFWFQSSFWPLKAIEIYVINISKIKRKWSINHYVENLKDCLFLKLWASLVVQRVKCLPAMRESQVWSLGQEDPLEKEMATHSSILAWRIPWTEEPGRLQSTGSQRVRHDWATSLTFTFSKPKLNKQSTEKISR